MVMVMGVATLWRLGLGAVATPSAFVEHDSLKQVFFADTENHCIRRYRFGLNDVVTVAGLCGSPGNVRGTGVPFVATRLWEPTTLAFLKEHNELYLTDSGNNQLVSLSVSATTGLVLARSSNQLSSVVQFRDATANSTNQTALRGLWPLHSVSMRFFAGITMRELTRHPQLQMFGSGEVLFSFEHSSEGCYFIVGKRHALRWGRAARYATSWSFHSRYCLPKTWIHAHRAFQWGVVTCHWLWQGHLLGLAPCRLTSNTTQ